LKKFLAEKKKRINKKRINIKRMINMNDTNKQHYKLMQDKVPESSFHFSENINSDKLKFLEKNFDECYMHYGKFKDPNTKQIITDKKTALSYIQKRIKEKTNEIKYSSRSKVGRLTTSAWCLQNMNKICRHFLSDGNNYDIDIVNAHPTFLLWWCNIFQVPCKNLDEYVNRREECFEEYMSFHNCSRDEAKDNFLSLINDENKLIHHDDVLYDFYNEIKDIQKKLYEFCITEHPDIIKKSKEKKGNIKGACIANFLQTIENKVLQTMIEFVRSKDFDFIAPCHDGGLLPKDKVDEYGLEKLIEDLEFYVFDKLNIKIKLSQKPMDKGDYLDTLYSEKKEIEKERNEYNRIFTVKYEKKQVIDDYCWNDFWMETRDVFDSLSDLLNFIREYLPKVLIKINHGKGFYLKNEGCNEHTNDKFNAVSGFGFDSLQFHYLTISKKNGEETVTLPLWKVIELSKVNVYSNIVCDPENRISRNEFNLWIPFIADKKVKYDITRVEPILDYIKTIICNNDEKVYRWFFSWLYHICKYPHIKTGVVPLLFSKKQRAGKGTFVNWLISCVFGMHCSYQTNITKLTGHFNSFLQGKVLLYIDELPTTSQTYHNIFDKLKNLITDPFLDIEKKGIDSYQTNNLLNFIASTNNKYSVKIEKGDGRWVVIAVNEDKIGDRKFWDHHHQNVFTTENGVHFFNYMMNIYDDDELLVNIKDIPQTEIREEIQEMSLSSQDTFLQELKARQIDIPVAIMGYTETDEYNNIKNPLVSELEVDVEYKVRVKDFYTLYYLWCDETNATKCNRKFLMNIVPKKRNNQGWYYII